MLCGHRFASFHVSEREFTSALLKPLPFFPSATNTIALNELLSTQEILGLSVVINFSMVVLFFKSIVTLKILIFLKHVFYLLYTLNSKTVLRSFVCLCVFPKASQKIFLQAFFK